MVAGMGRYPAAAVLLRMHDDTSPSPISYERLLTFFFPRGIVEPRQGAWLFRLFVRLMRSPAIAAVVYLGSIGYRGR